LVGWQYLEDFNREFENSLKKLRICMNILKWTIIVIAGLVAVTIVAVTFLVTNSANTILSP